MNKNLKLGGILIILIILAWLYQGPLQNWRSKVNKSYNFLSEINLDQINKIEITANNQTTVLEKIESLKTNATSTDLVNVKWKIGSTKEFYIKDSDKENLINSLKNTIESDFELVSVNPNKRKEFQTDESGIQVKLFQGGNKIVDFIVGKTGPNFTSTYIAKHGGDSVYLVQVNLYAVFNKSDWYDYTIFDFEKDKISKIRFQYPDRQFSIEKQNNKWQGVAPNKFSVNSERLEKILEIMSNLSAVEIPEQKFEDTDLEKHLIIVQVVGDKINNTIMIGKNNGEDLYFAKKGDSDNIYLISKEERDELNIQINDLK